MNEDVCVRALLISARFIELIFPIQCRTGNSFSIIEEYTEHRILKLKTDQDLYMTEHIFFDILTNN